MQGAVGSTKRAAHNCWFENRSGPVSFTSTNTNSRIRTGILSTVWLRSIIHNPYLPFPVPGTRTGTSTVSIGPAFLLTNRKGERDKGPPGRCSTRGVFLSLAHRAPLPYVTHPSSASNAGVRPRGQPRVAPRPSPKKPSPYSGLRQPSSTSRYLPPSRLCDGACCLCLVLRPRSQPLQSRVVRPPPALLHSMLPRDVPANNLNRTPQSCRVSTRASPRRQYLPAITALPSSESMG